MLTAGLPLDLVHDSVPVADIIFSVDHLCQSMLFAGDDPCPLRTMHFDEGSGFTSGSGIALKDAGKQAANHGMVDPVTVPDRPGTFACTLTLTFLLPHAEHLIGGCHRMTIWPGAFFSIIRSVVSAILRLQI